MRFSFKKTLATVLSIAMILSAFVGVLTTSAADATVVGSLTMEDVNVTASDDNTFDVVANVALNAEASYVELAYKLGTLPEGVTLTNVAIDNGEVYIDADTNAIHASIAGPVAAAAITMTFTAAKTAALDTFTLGIAAVAYADLDEADETLDITDTAEVTVINHAPADKYSVDSTYHWYACQVEGCEETFSKGYHAHKTEVIREATCTQNSRSKHTCTVCARSWEADDADTMLDHNYVDGVCSMCGQEDPDAVCNHENVEAIRTVTIADGAYTYNTICADCGEIAATETISDADSAVVSETVAGFASYAAIEMTEAGTATVPFAGTGSVKVAYVDGAKVMASNGLNTYHSVVDYDPVKVTVADGVATIDSTKTGIIIVFTLANSTNLDKVLTKHSVGTAFVLESTVSFCMKLPINANYTNAAFDDQYVKIVHHAFNGNTPAPVEETIYVDPEEEVTSVYNFYYNLAAKEFGDYIDIYYYGVKDGVTYPIRVQKDNGMMAYATSTSVFGATKITDSVKKLQNLVANMLLYATEAQKYFAYNIASDETLARNNPAVKAYIDTFLAEDELSTRVFSAEELKVLNAMNNYTPVNSAGKNIVGLGRSLALEDKVEINFMFNMANYIKEFGNVNDVTFQVTYYNEGLGKEVTEDILPEELSYKNSIYTYAFDKYPAKAMGTNVKVSLLKNGEEYAYTNYTIYTYVAVNYDSTSVKTGSTNTLGDLCKAIGAYGEAAKLNFAK